MSEQLADLSKLGNLGNALKLMNKEGDLKPVKRTQVELNEDDGSQEKPLPEFKYVSKSKSKERNINTPVSEDRIKESGLPASIKQSFLAKQIIVEANVGNDDAIAKKIKSEAGILDTQEQPQPVKENLVGLSESKIREIVKDEMLKYFSGTVIKNVTEQVVKKVKIIKK